jgi:hypothetical protein
MSRFTRATAKTKANSVSCLSRESHDWDSQLGCPAGSLTSVRWHTGWRDVAVLTGARTCHMIAAPLEDLSRPQSRLGQHLVHWVDQRWTPFDGPVSRSLGPTWMDPEVVQAIWDYRLMREDFQ